MRRTIIVGVAIAAALILIPASAQARPPTRELQGYEDFVLTDHCTFDINVEFLENREVVTTHYDSSGEMVRQSVTGTLKVRLTNLEDPQHSMLFNISGPSQFRLLPDGTSELTATGASIQLYITNRPGELLLVHGRFIAHVTDEEFNVTEISHNVRDTCALLS
jgi:hypothetical protein